MGRYFYFIFYICCISLNGLLPKDCFAQQYDYELQLAGAKQKHAILTGMVVKAKANGIETNYEEITLFTAGLFLDLYIPWDIAHQEEVTKAFSASITACGTCMKPWCSA